MTFLNNYLQKIVPEKTNVEGIENKIKNLVIQIGQHITGDYQIGIGDIDFEVLTENTETITNIVAYSDDNKLNEMLLEGNEDELAIGIVDGTIGSGLIPSNYKEEANKRFNLSPENVKTFFKDSIYNIMHLNEKVTNVIAHITKMDTEESKELNTNIAGKLIGGLAYDLFSGTLIKKRHFTPVTNSESMLEQIEKEGILHFTSAKGAEKIMESRKIKTSNFLESDVTRKKCFFFAGVPTFEDLLINIPAYDVMQAVRIRPTQEQMKQLKYRALNDRAVVKDGEFVFEENQAELVYYGLMYDKEKNRIYLGELDEEQAKDFKVSQEVRDAYHYEGKKSSLQEKIKMNAYGLYAEYKHHQKLLQMENVLREKGLNNFRNVNDRTLVELADFEQAYIRTKDKSVERKNLLETIKLGIMKNKEVTKEERDDDQIVH